METVKGGLLCPEINLLHGDCLELMKDIPDGSVDLVLTDPPYNIGKSKDWDKWDTVQEYINFMGSVFSEAERILKPVGSLYFFHNDMPTISRLMEWLRANTNFRYNSFIVLNKGNWRAISWKNPSKANNLRCWFNTCEYALCYTLQDGTGLSKMLKHPAFYGLQDFFRREREKTGKTASFLDSVMGVKSSYCYWEKPTTHPYRIPNKGNYLSLQNYFDGIAFSREYESLRQEYESQRFTHNLDPEHNNVIAFKRDKGKNYHVCQKPQDILTRFINCSSNPGETVLDMFMGSGSTGVACVNTGRNFIGIELDNKYFDIAKERINGALLSLDNPREEV